LHKFSVADNKLTKLRTFADTMDKVKRGMDLLSTPDDQVASHAWAALMAAWTIEDGEDPLLPLTVGAIAEPEFGA
jgi:hypothetical protein